MLTFSLQHLSSVLYDGWNDHDGDSISMTENGGNLRVLFFRPDHIGDVLLTTPVMRALKSALPECSLTVAVGSWAKPVIEHNPCIDDIVEIDCPWLRREGPAQIHNFITQIRALRSQEWTYAFNFRKALKETAIFRLVGGANRFGFDVWKCRWAHPRLTKYLTGEHVVDNYLRLLEPLGIPVEHRGLELMLPDNEEAVRRDTPALPEQYIVVSPGSGYPEKAWVSTAWKLLVRRIRTRLGIPIVLSGTRGEWDFIENIRDPLDEGVINCAGRFHLQELARVIKSSQGVLSLDSAAMHFGVAMKTPVFALFGYTDPVHWGPYPNGVNNHVVYQKPLKSVSADEVFDRFQSWYREIRAVQG